MSAPRDGRGGIDPSIFPDEIGLEYAVYGEYRLRSACQPIFAPRDGLLVPVAAEALIQPRYGGLPVPAKPFLESVPQPDRLHVEALCRALHLRNFHFVGVAGLDLFFNYDPQVNDHLGHALAEIALMVGQLGDYGLDAGMLVCEITERAAGSDFVLQRLALEMRSHGVRIAVDDFGAGHSTAERLRLLEPDIVKIDGAWFGRVCRHAAAERLFARLLVQLHDSGAKVLVEGVERPDQLEVALEGGADLLQGHLLARPALVGSIFPERPLAIGDLLRQGAKVIPLFG